MPSSAAHKRAVNKYNEKAYQKTLIRLKPDIMQAVRSRIGITGESLNGFITAAIIARLEAATPDAPPEDDPTEQP